MLEQLETIDRELFLWLNSQHKPWLDQPMYIMTNEMVWIPLYLFLLYSIYRVWSWQVMLWSLLAVALSVTITDRVSVELFKNVFLRYRPTHHADLGEVVHTVNNYRGGRYGFISSHAANFFGISTLLFFLLRTHFGRWAWLLFLWAGLIAYTRIYLGVHYPADIACGALLGIVSGSAVYALFNIFVLRKWARRS